MSEKDKRNSDDDHELVLQCRKGNLDAFESLVIKHQKKMLNIAFRIVNNHEDACEIVQDAFLSAYNGIHRFEMRSSFSTWLCTIVLNASRNRLQQLKSAERHEKFSLDDPVPTDSGCIRIELASDRPSAAEQLENRQLQSTIQHCIDKLDSEFKEVLILRDIQGFSYAEICDMLKIAEGTVKSRLSRARSYMKNCLQKVLGE